MEEPPETGADEIGWTWKRKPWQGDDLMINLSYRRKVLSDIKSVLTDVGGDKLLQQFVDGCFGHLLSFIGGSSCNRALHELITREIILAGAKDNELWFRIGETNIRFSPVEYALVTGLRFGSSSFDPLESHETPPEGVFNRLCSGRPINIRELWNMFNQRRLSRSLEDYLKVAHVLALNIMALGYNQLQTVKQWMWALVDDLDAWNRFPWGAYTYQALVHFVSILSRKRARVRRYNFNGPAWALQIWSYEAIPCLGKKAALVRRPVTVPRCLNWSFPRRNNKFPKRLLERKLDCCVTLEPTNEEKRQPYWLSLQTEQPLHVRYTSRQSRKQGHQGAGRRRGVATAASLCQRRPRRSSIRTPIVESSLGEPEDQIEVRDTDDSVRSTPKPSASPSRRGNHSRASKGSSLSSGGRPCHVLRWPDLLDEARFADRVSSSLVDQMIKPMAEEVTRILIESMVKPLIPHLKQQIGELFQARELETENPGDLNADCAKCDKKKEEQSIIDGGSSSMLISRKTVDEPSPGLLKKPTPKGAFGREGLMNDPRLYSGVAGHGKSFASQEDPPLLNVESRLKWDGSIRAQSDSSEKEGMRPPRAGEANEPELLAEPFACKTATKKKSSSTSKRRRQSPSANEETSDDEGDESSSGDERRRKIKRGKRKKWKRCESRLSESSEIDRHRRRRNKHKHRRASSSESNDARGSVCRHRHRRPRRHRSVSSSD